MTVRFVAEAQREYFDAVVYYERASAGLGARFEREMNRIIGHISDQPELLSVRHGGYRRINLRTFPFYLPYVVRGDVLWVLAVAHAKRRPLYWISRRKDAL
ncbi:MAG: type II toxin-antitoxin system RelE/ParE family toxin [Chthoniobacteraceae bacterium]